ncbi:hypothetical protein O181_067793 [Austropuccinia psidii MF-1]|uniref:Uncharacterized protein n=1 Tax=Austropuccinia psidii MF-1 TaxID=1389203 RepID=A0A9Q3EU30_9BASI|nr:hypothetical protein [Austropuccinia psidii MF-1]
MSEFMIHRKTLRKCGGHLEHAVKSRTTEQSSVEDIINILEEVTTRTRIGSSRMNLKTRINTPLKDSVDKNLKENSNNMKYKSAYIDRKGHICQSTTHLANSCPSKGKINKINIEKEPDVEKDDYLKIQMINNQYFMNVQKIYKISIPLLTLWNLIPTLHNQAMVNLICQKFKMHNL